MSPCQPVLSKKQFARMYKEGVFGNASPTFDTLEEAMAFPEFGTPGYHLWHIRNRVAGGKTYYNVPWIELDREWHKLSNKSQWYISCMAPTERTIIQGEVMRLPISSGCPFDLGLHLYYSTVRKPMRDALAEKSHSVSGILSYSLLKGSLCPKSLEWLEHLLDEYPNHVVEFSTYEIEWGTVPGFNTVFWECRMY